MKNVMLLFCGDVTFSDKGNREEHIARQHPELSGENWWLFQSRFLKAYFHKGFYIAFWGQRLFSADIPVFSNALSHRNIVTDEVTNDLYLLGMEEALKQDPEKYYQQRAEMFYERTEKEEFFPKRIDGQKLAMLEEIREIFRKHDTKYEVIISPLYDQKKMYPEDLEIVRKIFSAQNVHDYSGINDITQHERNYFESSHYRYHVGIRIMNELYEN